MRESPHPGGGSSTMVAGRDFTSLPGAGVRAARPAQTPIKRLARLPVSGAHAQCGTGRRQRSGSRIRPLEELIYRRVVDAIRSDSSGRHDSQRLLD